MSTTTQRLSLLALEPRFVFDGAMVYTFDDAAQAEAQREAEQTAQRLAEESRDQHNSDDLALSEADLRAPATPREVVFVDGSIENLEGLLSALRADVERVVVRPGEDGLAQVLAHLANSQPYDALHIFGHGSAGVQLLGSSVLNTDTVSGALTQQLQELGEYLTADADLLLYGCDVAQGEGGATLIRELARLTGADVAASTNVTGRGGDWVLESAVGTVEAQTLQAPAWAGDLSTINLNDIEPEGCYLPVQINLLANDFHDNGTLVPGSVDLDPSTPGRQTTADARFGGQVVGEFRLSDDGVVTFVPNDAFRGQTDPLSYSVSDAMGLTRTSTVTIGAAATPVTNTIENTNSLELFQDFRDGYVGDKTTQTLRFGLNQNNPTSSIYVKDYDYNSLPTGTAGTGNPLAVTLTISDRVYDVNDFYLYDLNNSSFRTFARFNGADDFTSALSGTRTGVSSSNNMTFQVHVEDRPLVGKPHLDANGDPIRYPMGKLTVTFNEPVTNPLMHIGDLGGRNFDSASISSNISLTTELKLSGYTTFDGAPPVFSRLSSDSGDRAITVNNANGTITRLDRNSGDAGGTVRVQANGVTSLTFDISLWGVNFATSSQTTTWRDLSSDRFGIGFTAFNRAPEANPDTAEATKVCGINDVIVNEGSPYAVFKVDGYEGRMVKLDLQSGTATVGVDTGTTADLEYWDGNAWQPYTEGSYVQMPGDGDSIQFEATHLLVRVPIVNDDTREVSEELTLTATYGSGNAVTGTLTIKDDGTGTMFATSATNNGVNAAGLPLADVTTPRDNDTGGAPYVNNVVVNEGSPFTVFTIEGVAGAGVTLALADGTAKSAAGSQSTTPDYVQSLEVFDGTEWVAYNAASTIIGSTGTLLVRVPVLNDDLRDNGETFTLTATYVGTPGTDTTAGKAFTGTATIRDDGTGTIFATTSTALGVDTTTGLPTTSNAAKDNDSPPTINSVLVNEGSPYMVFTVEGVPGGAVLLNAQSGTATLGTDTGTTWQVLQNGEWVNYTMGGTTAARLGFDGELLVRVAVTQDATYEVAESFTLTAQYTQLNITGGTSRLPSNMAGWLPPFQGTNGMLVYVEPAGNYTSSFQGTDRFTFNGLAADTNFSLTPQVWTGVGTFTSGIIEAGGPFGGAFEGGVQTNYAHGRGISGQFRTITLELDQPADMVGAWWSAGGRGDSLELYQGDELLATFTTDQLPLGDDYRGRSTAWRVGSTNPYSANELFAFLNIVAPEGRYFDKVVFKGSIEVDNFTVRKAELPIPPTTLNYDTIATGVGTIVDDGTGVVFGNLNKTGTPDVLGVTADPSLPTRLDDDRPLTVTGTTVNEASPYVLWTVSGVQGQLAQLALADGTAKVGTDTGTALEYFNGSNWVAYTPGRFVQVPTVTAAGEPGALMVRTTSVVDELYETSETVLLKASNQNGVTAQGTSFILDGEEGAVYGANVKPLLVIGQTVLESAGTLGFTVTGVPGERLTLALQSGTGTVGTDTGAITASTSTTGVEVYVGTAWVPYTTGMQLTLPDSGTLQVRVSVTDDTDREISETIHLLATPVGGMAAVGVGTILDNESAGLAPLVNSVVVNEASPYAVFTVDGVAGAGVTLTLANGTATGTTSTTPPLDGTADFVNALEVFNGTAWVPYNADTTVIGADGKLQVRVAIVNDEPVDNGETFQLTATYNTKGVTEGVTDGGTSTGTATIMDNGTGTVFLTSATMLGMNAYGVPQINFDLPLNDDGMLMGGCVGPQGDETSYKGRLIVASFHSAMYRAKEGGYFVAGQQIDPTGAGNVTIPVLLTPENGFNYEGDLIDVAAGGGNPQHVLVTTKGMWVWGEEGRLVHGALTTGSQFQKIALPDAIKPAEIKFISGSEYGGLALVMNDGTVWVNLSDSTSASNRLYGDGRTVKDSSFKQVLTGVGTPLVGVTDLEFYSKGVFAYSRDSGKFYTWGPGVALGSEANTRGVSKDYATEMVSPLPEGVDLLQLQATGDSDGSTYYVLGTDGRVYVLGGNTEGQAGQGNRTYVNNWTTVRNEDGTGPLENVAFISAQNGTVDMPSASAVLKDGKLLSWGANSKGMIGLPGDGFVLLPTEPNWVEGGKYPVLAVENGGHFTAVIAVGRIGEIATVGHNPGGAFGDGTTEDKLAYELLPFLGKENGGLANECEDKVEMPLGVNSISVNEASPYAVFTVVGKPGATVQLSVASGTATGTSATTPTTDGSQDFGTQLEYWNGTSWAVYDPASTTQPVISDKGNLLVRVAIVNDQPADNGETFTLTATYPAVDDADPVSATGTGTIKDDGTGTIFRSGLDDPATSVVENPTGVDPATGLPLVSNTALKNDDRPLQVSGTTVNEASPYVLWTVEGAQGQMVTLVLQDGTGDVGADVAPELQVFNGTDWVDYTPGSYVAVPTVTDAGEPGVLMVRAKPLADTDYEMSETVFLQASSPGGVAALGASTIVDDGTGMLLGADVTPVVVTGETVTEGDGFLGFTVSGKPGEQVTLALQDGTGTVGTDTAEALEYSLDGGTTWIAYNPTSLTALPKVTLPADGVLQVRVAVVDDTDRETTETIALVATPTSGIAATGVGTIVDDEPAGAAPVVNSIRVNEASPFAVFTVEGLAGAGVSLTLGNDTDAATRDATLGTDTVQPTSGTPLQVFNGTAWVDYDPAATVIGTSGTLLVRVAIVDDATFEGAEVFNLTVAYNTAHGVSTGVTNGATATGTATILDDGTGVIFATRNDDPNTPTTNETVLGVDAFGHPLIDPVTPKNDDRTLSVNDLVVNEGSPYAVFTITANAGEPLTLKLTSDTATVGVDTGTVLEYFDGTAWVPYQAGSSITVPGSTAGAEVPLLVRVAIVDDAALEVSETFTLTASYANGSQLAATGSCEIRDDGTGTVFVSGLDDPATPTVENPTGVDPSTGLPLVSTTAPKDNDRPLTIDGQTVNEASPYLVFTVTGQEGQPMLLSLNSGTGTVGVDTGTALEVFDGTAWVPYTPGQLVMLPDNGDSTPNETASLLVRVAVVNDAHYEGAETIILQATSPDGAVASGVGTIVDDGTGVINTGTVTAGVPDTVITGLNDDRGANPAVNSVTVNEGSPYAVFTVTGVPSAGVTLNLADGTAMVGVDTGSTLEVLVDGAWVAYTAANAASIELSSTGELLVRVAIAQDTPYEVSETFSLVATYNASGTTTTGITVGGSGAGTGTILDDGTGAVFLATNLTGTPNAPADTGYPAHLDDDRPVTVTGHSVYESEGFMTFTLTAYPGQSLSLALGSTGTGAGHATLSGPGADVGTALEFWNGTTWAPVSGAITVPALNDSAADEPVALLVRVAVNADSTAEPDETLALTATTASGKTATGVGTIMDGGTLLADDDRPLTVTGSTVNEASPYLVFSVAGVEGQLVRLSLADGTAQVGVDTADQLQYFNGTEWVDYTPGSYVAIPNDGNTVAGESAQLLVRVAVLQDDLAEVSEFVTLVATNTGGRPASDQGYIRDDGTGVVFLADNETGTPNDPADPGYPTALDFDRPLSVNSVRVNEASPFAVFTVTGVAGQGLNLALADGTAQVGANGTPLLDGSEDYGSTLQFWNGSTWATYTAVTPAVVGADGLLLVRVAIVDDTPFEGEQTFTLTASYASGSTPAATGTGTIVDDGTGTIYATTTSLLGVDPISGLPLIDVLAPKNDDRANNPLVNSPTVNEGSPFMVFTVDGMPGALVKIEPSSGTAVLGTDTGTQWQVLVNGTWTNYTVGADAPVGSDGKLLVRVAVTQDAAYEVAEQLSLTATYTGNGTAATPVTVGGSGTGVGTIVDDGTGDVFGNLNKTGAPDVLGVTVDPSLPVRLDDDRPLVVTGTTVNEGSPYVVWTVDGMQGQLVQLALQSGTATVGVDTGTALEYFNGSDWVAYTPGSFVSVPTVTDAGEPGTLMVRTTVVQDAPYEMSETVLLQATNVGGTPAVGASTIVDDGTGMLLGADVTPVVVTGETVTEGEGVKLGFTVSGAPGELVTLALQDGTGTVGTDTTGPLQVLVNGTWVDYDGQPMPIPTGGALQVRVAVVDDTDRETTETIALVATPTSGIAATGVGTIVDNEPAGAAPVVNSIRVNEASPFAVFTVEGLAGAGVSLTLGNDTDAATRDATLGTDTVQPTTGTPLQVFNGTAWVDYDPAATVIGTNGKLLVRVAIVDDAPYEGAEVFNLTVAYNTAHGVSTGVTNGASATGTATILDDGTGTIFLTGADTDPATPGIQPNLGVDAFGNPQLDDITPKNDDRTLSVNSLVVNEGSPYAVFTVMAVKGEDVLLNLSSGTATIGVDTGGTLEVFVNGAWVPYTAATRLTVPTDGDNTAGESVPLLVRVAIRQDAVLEATAAGGEKFTLTVSYADGTRPPAVGTCEILDNGLGDIFDTELDPDTGLPQLNTTALKDNDRPLSVTGETVSESAGHLVFTISGQEGQAMRLSLNSGTGTVGADTGSTLEVFNGTTWEPYSPGSLVTIPSDGDATPNEPANLLVRVAVIDDTAYEQTETVILTVTAANGNQVNAVGTILDNDSAGANPAVNSVTVNEGSPYAVFSVKGVAGAGVSLTLGSDTATVGVDTGDTLEVFDGTNWVPYSATTTVPTGGELLVRVAIKQDADFEKSESFTLTATYNDAGTTSGITVGGTSTGVGTITDDGTGSIFLSTRNSATPNQPGDYGFPSTLDDDRGVMVEGDTVYEGDGFLLFAVSGTEGQPMRLSLSSTADTNAATLGTDTGTQLQYWNGSIWVNYTQGAVFTMPDNNNGVSGESVTVQFRVAVIEDNEVEETESLTLTATALNGKSSSAEGFILDGASPTPVLDDDRPLDVNDVTVNEGSPFAVFTVSGAQGQLVKLSLGATSSGADATLGTDTGALQYWDGTDWLDYNPGSYVAIPVGASGLLVRVAITNDGFADNGETYTLRATNKAGRSDTGLGTIMDDGTGTVFQDADPVNGVAPVVPTANDPVAAADAVLADDDRPLTVNDLTVNEGSPYAVFTVGGREGQYVQLALGSTSTGTDASLSGDNADMGTQLQYWNGTTWANYTAGTFVKIPGENSLAANLLVRVKINQDAPLDNGETFTLTATNTGRTPAVGTGTIMDDGTGTIFVSGLDDPALPGVQDPSGVGPNGLPLVQPPVIGPVVNPALVVVPDDDRPVSVNSVTVNEASPFIVFTVSAKQGQLVGLDVASGTATIGTDTAASLEYWNGTAWTIYQAGTFVRVPGADPALDAPLLVRLAVTQDSQFESAERFTLTVSNTGGGSANGTGTIVDDGTGDIFAMRVDDPATPANEAVIGIGTDGLPLLDLVQPKDDDRPLSVNSLTVDEGSPYAVFTVTSAQGQPMTLTLGSGTATVGTDTGADLQYWDGSRWVDYTGAFNVPGPVANATVNLLVRVAIVSDADLETSENFTLTANYTSGAPRTSTGTGTIVDAGQGTGTVFVTSDTVAGVNTDGTPATRTLVTTPVAAADAVLADDDRPLTVNDVEVNEASPFLVWTVGGKQGQYVQLGLSETGSGDGHAKLGIDTGTEEDLQYWSGSAWLDYTPGTFVRIPGAVAANDGQMLVRLAVKNDFLYEDRETLTLTATNVGGSSVDGEGAIRDDGKGLLFGPANNTGTPDTLQALGLQVLDDDRVAPPLPEPAAAPPAPIAPPLPPTAPALHVQMAVQDGRQATSGMGNQSMLAGVTGRTAGQFSEGINVQKRLDNLIDKFDRPTDPNLFVLPQVKDTRGQAFDAKAPTIELQSGILFESSQSAGTLPGIFVVGQVDGQGQSLTASADAELERATAAVSEAEQAMPWWQAEALEAEQLQAARLQHLAAAHAVMAEEQGDASAQGEASAQPAQGKLGFSAKLKANARQAVSA